MSAEQNTNTKGLVPFEIRGHHLRHYADIYTRVLYARKINKSDEIEIADYIGGMISKVMFRDIIEAGGLQIDGEPRRMYEGLTYKQDLLGFSDKDEKTFAQSAINTFLRFLRLPDGEIVIVTIGKPDTLCRSCIVGRHCLEKGPSGEDREDERVKKLFFSDSNSYMDISAGKLKRTLLSER